MIKKPAEWTLTENQAYAKGTIDGLILGGAMTFGILGSTTVFLWSIFYR